MRQMRIIGLGFVITLGLMSVWLLLASSPSQAASPIIQATSTLLRPTLTPSDTGTPPLVANARPIAVNSVGEGELDAGQWDIWEVQGMAGDILTITLNSIQFDAYLELYSVSGALLADDDDGGRFNDAQLLEIEIPVDGVYRIFARSYDDEGAGKYRLYVDSLTNLGADTNSAIPTRYNAIEHGLINDYEAVFAFEGRREEIVTIDLASREFDTYLVLVDSRGNILAENDNDEIRRSNDSAIINFPLSATDTYYVFVRPYELAEKGRFGLNIYNTAQITEAPGGHMRIGETATGDLTPNSYADWLFEGNAGQIVSIGGLTAPPRERLNLQLELYTSDGELVDADDDSGLTLNPALTDIELPADGEYRIRIMENNPTIGGMYYIGLAEGRVYFDPYGEPAPIIFLNDEHGQTDLQLLGANNKNLALWVVSGVEEAPFTITLSTTAGEASKDDFIIRVFDTDWVFMADTQNGFLSMIELSEFSSEYLVLVEYTGIGQRDYELSFSAED